jgi:PAS domain-containing protein
VPSRTALVQVALRTSAARLGRSTGTNALSLLDSAPIPALVTRGEQHLVEYANPAARSVLRLADIGVRLTDLFPREAVAAVGAIADASFHTSEGSVARAVALHHPDADAAWRRADVFARPVRDGAEQLAGLVVFLVDASEHVGPRLEQTKAATQR